MRNASAGALGKCTPSGSLQLGIGHLLVGFIQALHDHVHQLPAFHPQGLAPRYVRVPIVFAITCASEEFYLVLAFFTLYPQKAQFPQSPLGFLLITFVRAKLIFGEREKKMRGEKMHHASPPAALLEGISCVCALRVPQADLVIMSTWMWRACVRARFGPVLDSYAA